MQMALSAMRTIRSVGTKSVTGPFTHWEYKRRTETMTRTAEEKIVRNLAKALERVSEDLDKVELWTAALGYFQTPVPDYQPGDRFLLPLRGRDAGS
jgi:hypothetical protein